MSKLPQSFIDFDEFLNEPPIYEDKYMVREYRHEAYAKWKLVLADARTLIVAEREACAKICEDSAEIVGATDLAGVLNACADFIRKRSNVVVSGQPREEEK